ncbi:hypothetical protein K488DRAFT_75781 [Vararia minispora EC-137]|uniref:Uncharacterized protein n=1 Tax=Vararia minispora EC-137 TaxID=1314806 RepID=A0ACB8QY50_9AGAM|nr:hypothetical protein K488DRAFT_75781 [Vararia minispora EC-137]
MQIPTPPTSSNGTPEEGQDLADQPSTVVSVSTSFHPTANLDSCPPDVCLMSVDSVFFYVHSHKLLAASNNAFNNTIPSRCGEEPAVVSLPEHSAELNVLLHAIYNLSAAQYSPPLDAVSACVDAMRVYGIDPHTHIAPQTPLFSLIMGLTPAAPLDCYALASSQDLYDLAVAISSFLLSYSLADITDEAAARIGPKYLKRLFFLHLGRAERLKLLLLPPPSSHPPTPFCDLVEQKRLTRAWALATAYLAWEAGPDLSTASIEAALRPLGEHLGCEQCQILLRERINNLVVQWSVVKLTQGNTVHADVWWTACPK